MRKIHEWDWTIMRFLDDGGKDLRHFIDYHKLLLQDRRNGLLKFYTQRGFDFDPESPLALQASKPPGEPPAGVAEIARWYLL